MVQFFRVFAVASVLLLAACAVPQEGTVNGALPPQAPGTARLIFYRGPDYTNTTAMSTVFLNGAATGVSQIDAAFFRDVAPGRYDITVFSPRTYPNQFKTVVVKTGDVFYMRIDALPKLPCTWLTFDACVNDTFIVTAVDPALGYQEIQGLRLIAG
jgi:hypothetical protein